MTLYERSAIIGYYRSGATYQEISSIIGIPWYQIKIIVDEYFKNKK
jgi:DNA-directed RNA polymerase specialized sigma24 family protein